MKKIIVMAIIGLAMVVTDIRAQTAYAEQAVTVSADYALSRLGFSNKYEESGSILSWRDIYLHGAQINVEFNKAPFVFNKTNIGVGFHKSFHGYHTDDDATNGLDTIYVSSTEATLLDLKYEILLENNRFSPKLGLDFNYLKLDNYNASRYTHYFSLWSSDLEGLVNKYDFLKYGLYGGMQMKITAGIFYINASGQIGTGIYLALADWILRTDFKHPISFYDAGFYFKSGGDLEIGLKLGRFTIFNKVLLIYEISPFGICAQRFSNDNTSIQFITLDFFRATLNTGLKISF